MQRKLSRSGYSTVANHGAFLAKTIRLDFSFTVSFQPAPFIFELHKRTTYLELLHILHTNCPPSSHTQFKPRNSAWYLASLIERDVNINRHIKPKEIRERAGLYHQLQNVPYMPAWRARERLRDIIDGDEGVSFSLIPDWIERVIDADNSTYIRLKTTHENQFEAIFIMLGSIRSRIHFLRPFYALDGTHTRSQYNLILLIAVGINAEDRILPFA